jgi:hypothetical protein
MCIYRSDEMLNVCFLVVVTSLCSQQLDCWVVERCGNERSGAFVDFMVISIQFNFYNNSNCPLITQNPRIYKKKGKAVPLQAWTGPQISWHQHMKVVGCQPYAPAAFAPRINLVLIFRGWVDPRAHETVRCHGKNPGNTGNRSRDLPTGSAVP